MFVHHGYLQALLEAFSLGLEPGVVRSRTHQIFVQLLHFSGFLLGLQLPCGVVALRLSAV